MQSKLPITSAESSAVALVQDSSPAQSKPAGGYWRSLNELDQTPEFRQFLEREFPQAASEFPSGVSRRRWLQLMAPVT